MKRILWFCAISVFVISESVPDELQDLPEKKNGKEKVRYARYVVSTFWLFFIIVTLLTFFAFYNTVTVFNV
ncbi:MAG: hypothetical protein KUG78_09540, partial [Kangiellaceae bacterium]|nr:hypothetical protein [Kangiellaceae bacterium]